MSKHNYSQYYNKKKDGKSEVAAEAVSNDRPVVTEKTIPVENVTESLEIVEETVDTVTLPETVEGIVVNCTKLNVRVSPSTLSDVVCVLNAQSEVSIDVAKSNNEWFHVCTATGVEGYCMRKFVNAHM